MSSAVSAQASPFCDGKLLDGSGTESQVSGGRLSDAELHATQSDESWVYRVNHVKVRSATDERTQPTNVGARGEGRSHMRRA